jgi:methionyl-tRNA formyltransferase
MQEKEPIYRSDTAGTLYERLMYKGAALVLQTVQAIEKGDVKTIQQQQIAMEELKNAPKIFKETCEINFHRSAEEVFNFVRGMNPFPTAWTRYNGRVYKIYKVVPVHNGNQYQPGEWHTDGKTFLHIGTTDGYVVVEELQAEGKKRMGIAEFLRGNKV